VGPGLTAVFAGGLGPHVLWQAGAPPASSPVAARTSPRLRSRSRARRRLHRLGPPRSRGRRVCHTTR